MLTKQAEVGDFVYCTRSEGNCKAVVGGIYEVAYRCGGYTLGFVAPVHTYGSRDVDFEMYQPFGRKVETKKSLIVRLTNFLIGE